MWHKQAQWERGSKLTASSCCDVQKEKTFTIKARPRGYHASLHVLQFNTERGRDISDILIAITNKWLLM